MRRFLFSIAVFLATVPAFSQKKAVTGCAEFVLDGLEVTPAGIDVDGATQGMAIWDKYAFCLHDGGQCVVFDLNKKKYISTFVLEDGNCHCNNASFGSEKLDASSEFPLLYVSECRGRHRALVYDVSLEDGGLVQQIFYTGKTYRGSFDWFVDREEGYIYTYGGSRGEKKIINKFYLPDIEDSGSDLVQTMDLNDIGLEPEGCAVKDNWLYVAFHCPGESRGTQIYKFRL